MSRNMSTHEEPKVEVSEEDVKKANQFKEQANEYFKSKSLGLTQARMCDLTLSPPSARPRSPQSMGVATNLDEASFICACVCLSPSLNKSNCRSSLTVSGSTRVFMKVRLNEAQLCRNMTSAYLSLKLKT